MEGLNKLENIILELLGTHQCVTVPGLGSFIYRESPAASNHFTFELKPSGNTVFFNNAIQADDGILANAVREKTGLGYSEALLEIRANVLEIENSLALKKNLAFGKLGNFFLNAEGHVFFLPSGALNLSRHSFGLPVIKLEELQKPAQQQIRREKPEIVAEPVFKAASEPVLEYEEAEVLEIEEPHRNRGLVWKIAAGFAIVTLSATGWYFGRAYLGSKQQKSTETATMDNAVKEEIPAVSGESSEVKAADETKGTIPAKVITTGKKDISEAKTAEAPNNGRAKEVTSTIVSRDAFYSSMKQKHGTYYVIGGSFIGEEMAKSECNKWNKVGVNATIHKPENSSLYRIILGRFDSEKAASDFVQTMPGFHGSTVSVRDLPILK